MIDYRDNPSLDQLGRLHFSFYSVRNWERGFIARPRRPLLIMVSTWQT